MLKFAKLLTLVGALGFVGSFGYMAGYDRGYKFVEQRTSDEFARGFDELSDGQTAITNPGELGAYLSGHLSGYHAGYQDCKDGNPNRVEPSPYEDGADAPSPDEGADAPDPK